jgi:hypothetical protein
VSRGSARYAPVSTPPRRPEPGAQRDQPVPADRGGKGERQRNGRRETRWSRASGPAAPDPGAVRSGRPAAERRASSPARRSPRGQGAADRETIGPPATGDNHHPARASQIDLSAARDSRTWLSGPGSGRRRMWSRSTAASCGRLPVVTRVCWRRVKGPRELPGSWAEVRAGGSLDSGPRMNRPTAGSDFPQSAPCPGGLGRSRAGRRGRAPAGHPGRHRRAKLICVTGSAAISRRGPVRDGRCGALTRPCGRTRPGCPGPGSRSIRC